MRKKREAIDQEDVGLSWTEKREKTRRIVEKDPQVVFQRDFWYLRGTMMTETSVQVDFAGLLQLEYHQDC